MKGKVNCTCGWSWNKSDSSAKDMYICHECGRDNSNNMKNGGWLDNYNDSQASAPEGMVGDGYSNVGRNYSPAWGGQFQMGGNIYPVNYVPEAQDGYRMGTYFDEDAREREPNMMEETYDDYNTAMTGMMKSKMATQAALGNKGAQRMMSSNSSKYIFTGNERFSDGSRAEGAGAYGTHYMSNRDNYVYPNLQDNGEGTLNFIPNASPSDREAMRFESPGEADYFANHYKEVAPMMKSNKMQMGGSLPGATGHMYARVGAPSNGKYAKKTMASAQNGSTIKYDSPEYAQAWKEGKIQNKTADGDIEPYWGGELDEVTINVPKREKSWLEEYRDKIVEENKDAGLLGAIIGTPISAITSLPQLMGMKALTGEMQRPSEAMNIQNPYGAMAVDAFLDPANAIGVGELSGLSKLTKEQVLSKLGKIPTNITSKLKQGLRSNGFSDTFKKKPNFQSGINTMEELPPLPEDFLTKIKKLQESSKSINMLKEDLADPETIRRAEALGVDPEIFAEASKNMTYSLSSDVPSSYISSDLEININPNQTGRTPEEAIMSGVMDSHSPNFTANEIGAHELGHFFQDTNYWKNPYPWTLDGYNRKVAQMMKGSPEGQKFLDYHPKYSTRNTAPTKVDEMLKDLEIRTGLDKEYYPQKNKNYFVDANKQYGTDVDNMIEKFPMFREYRQGMRDSGILKNKWDEITPENIEDFRKLKPENRLNSFMQFNDKNYKLLNEVSKIAPAVLPIGLGAASQIEQKREGGIIKDDRGQWDHPGKKTRIKGGSITMKPDPKTGKPLTQPILGIASTGQRQMMYPGQDYNFPNAEYVTEYPKGKMAQNGIRQEQKGLQNLDNLVNFTNYNKPQPGGWLNKYN